MIPVVVQKPVVIQMVGVLESLVRLWPEVVRMVLKVVEMSVGCGPPVG